MRRFALIWLMIISAVSLLAVFLLGQPARADVPPAQQTTTAILALYAFAFDNTRGSPADLTPTYTPTVQGIVSATAALPDRIAIILADLNRYGDTHILIASNGHLLAVDGLPTLDGHGNVGLVSTLNEFNMADGHQLGAFILWARQLFPAEQTTFTFVGHGGPLIPQLPLPNTDPQAPGEEVVWPLPPRWSVHSDLTDDHSASLLSVVDLGTALDIGTRHGETPLAVADLLHCSAATIEELYELHSYVTAITASPNYAYSDPQMLGAALAAIAPGMSGQEMATQMIRTYDAVLPAVGHPRLLVAVDATRLAGIKASWDGMAQALLIELANDGTAARQKIVNATLNSAKYDTTVCEPQEWQLAPPDALSDMADFATRLGAEFGAASSVEQWSISTTQAISQAVVSRVARSGSPWFTDLTPAPEWQFPAPGIAVFADFTPALVNGAPELSWQAQWYGTGGSVAGSSRFAFLTNPSAPTWADLFAAFWQGAPMTSTRCLPGFFSGRGVGELTALALPGLEEAATITVSGQQSISLAVQISTQLTATNPLVRFQVYRQGNPAAPIYESVSGAGYLPAGSVRTATAIDTWQPPTTGLYTVTAMIDADNRFVENDEADNTLAVTLSVTRIEPIFLPLIRRESGDE